MPEPPEIEVGRTRGVTIGDLLKAATISQDDDWFVMEREAVPGEPFPFTWKVRASQLLTRGQIMFTVPGTLSTDSDPCPWFICGLPVGMILESCIAVVKTPATGAPIAWDIWRSSDAIDWESVFTHIIPAGSYFSTDKTTFIQQLVTYNQLLRLAIGGTGTIIPGADLTVSLRVKPL